MGRGRRHGDRDAVTLESLLTLASSEQGVERWEPLDLGAMNEAARRFIGEHDFASFRSLGSDETTTIRRVYASEWRRDGNRFVYRVEASSFMRHMVRTMVATMIDPPWRFFSSGRATVPAFTSAASLSVSFTWLSRT